MAPVGRSLRKWSQAPYSFPCRRDSNGKHRWKCEVQTGYKEKQFLHKESHAVEKRPEETDLSLSLNVFKSGMDNSLSSFV